MSSISIVFRLRGSAPALMALRSAISSAAAMASSRVRSRKTWSASPLTRAIAAPTALAQSPKGDPDDLRNAGQAFRHQEGAAADGNQRRVAGLGFHAVDIFFELPRGVGERRGDHALRDRRCAGAIANIQQSGGDRDIGRGQLRAAEDKRVLRQAVADAERADPCRRRIDMAAAAEADRQQVRHAEQRAHAADLDDRIGLTRKAMAQMADIACCAADVHDHGVVDARTDAPRRASSWSPRRQSSSRGRRWPFRPASPCRRSG